MFEEFMGIPAHPLIVHSAVVFLPLQVLAGLGYALVGFLRRYIGWLVVALAVIAPLSALAAKLSGEALRDRLVARGTAGPALLPSIDQHNSFGNYATIASAVLGLLMILLVLLARSRASRDADSTADGSGTSSTVLAVILTVAMLGASGATAYYVFKTGDSGAKMVWQGM